MNSETLVTTNDHVIGRTITISTDNCDRPEICRTSASGRTTWKKIRFFNFIVAYQAIRVSPNQDCRLTYIPKFVVQEL